VHGLPLRSPKAMASTFLFFPPSSSLFSDGGDGCFTCDLRLGAGTTLVDQMRPAIGWRCRCLMFRSGEAGNGTSFGIEHYKMVLPSLLALPPAEVDWISPTVRASTEHRP